MVMNKFELYGVSIDYTEEKDAERGDFVVRDVLGLIKSHNDRYIREVEEEQLDVSIVYIQSISYKDMHRVNVPEALEAFTKAFKSRAIIYRANPNIHNIAPAKEVFAPLTGIENVQDGEYRISNTGIVRWKLDELGTVPAVLFKDGERVGLVCKDNMIRFYSVAYLIGKAFSTNSIVNDYWNEKMEDIVEDITGIGFESINSFCRLEFSEVFIFNNATGRTIINEIAALESEFEEESKRVSHLSQHNPNNKGE